MQSINREGVCPRCGNRHSFTFKGYSGQQPPFYTCWAICQSTGEPLAWEELSDAWQRYELPVPPEVLHPNSSEKGQWRAAHCEKAPYLEVAIQAAEQQRQKLFGSKRPGFTAAFVRLGYFWDIQLRKRKERQPSHDPDNLIAWAKAPIDSLQRAGILSTDRRLIYYPPEQLLIEGQGKLVIDVLPFREIPEAGENAQAEETAEAKAGEPAGEAASGKQRRAHLPPV